MLAVGGHRDVVDDAHPVAQALCAAPLQGLPDGGQAEGLAGVDGDVEVGVVDELEGIQVAAGREARLRPGDVEAHHAPIAVANGELRDLDRSGELAHGRDDGADDDGSSGRGGVRGHPARSRPARPP